MTYIKSLVFVQGGEKRKTHTFVSSAFVPLFCIYAAAYSILFSSKLEYVQIRSSLQHKQEKKSD
jgi:hypothetical protein